MVADGLLTRERYREVPPRVEYELTDRSRSLVPVLGALARWGYEWTWGAPRPKEKIDIGAILRLAPGLIKPEEDQNSSVECIVQGSDRQPDRSYLISIENGRVLVQEQQEAIDADTKVTGKASAWAQAFSPGGSLSVLEFSGDQAAAKDLLRAFTRAASKAGAAVPA
jgi:hypothetical protein